MLLLVAKMGVTKTDAAERSIELLNRLDIAIAGVVLVGAASATNDYYYYYQPGRVAAAGVQAPKPAAPQPQVNGNGRANGARNNDDLLVAEPERPASSAD
jgi:Mrp family chromosome partitioning ATPase